MSTNTTFQQYLQSAYTSGPWATDEVIEFVLPLFEEVLSFHENGLVGSFETPDTIFLTDGRLDIDENFTHPPVSNISAIQPLLDYQQIHGYTITGRTMVDVDLSKSAAETINLQVESNPNASLNYPVYLPGFGCYELKLGHHDAQTDIFCLGLVLASAVMGLDLYDTKDLNTFAAYRNQPAGLNPRMHPTLCGLVTEMTELHRNDRTRDLGDVIQRLKYYRDYDPQRETDLSQLASFQIKKPTDRKSFILSKLRNRLFDTSRRNRLLYYKPNARFVNLTVSSVPMVLHYQSINPQLLFTWNEEISAQIIAQKDISLNKFLRFEDHPYLNAQLNGIRQLADHDEKEFGFKQLKLVVAFLHWHNLKEVINERIQSPLLLLPVDIKRKKSLKEERFTLEIKDNAALVNPILANHLKDLYGIELPESIDFDEVSMKDFFTLVETKINAAKQGVKLNLIDKPRIKIVHTIARQTINNYRKRLKLKGSPAFQQVDYSYSEENYKPLGLELFRQKVEPRQTELEFLLSDIPSSASTANFADKDSSQLKSTFHLTDGDSNPYSWDFDICNIVLGNFNYKKMSLVSDYNKVATDNVEHAVFTELFSNTPRYPEEPAKEPALSESFHVINADPTQSKAVAYSRTGKSYIIQGPPGTGKSQTITNLIADFLAHGKTVLFVCEKRAALDVVYHRLQQNKLAELCCYIHDSQGDKKEFYKDLKTIYEDFVKNKMDLSGIAVERAYIIGELQKSLELLKTYHETQVMVSREAGISTRALVEKLVGLKDSLPPSDKKKQESIPDYTNWLSYGEVIRMLGKALEESGADPQFSSHPFSNLGLEVVRADNPLTLMESLVSHSYASIQEITAIVGQQGISPQHADKLESIKNLVQDSVLLMPLAESKNLRLVDTNNPESKEFEQQYAHYKTKDGEYQKTLDLNKRWQNKIEKEEVAQALSMAQRHEKSFFSFLNGGWRKLKRKLKESYDFAGHAVKPTFSLVLEQLQEEYRQQELVVKEKAELENKYRVSNIDMVYTGVDVLRRKQGDQEIDYLLQHPQSNELVIQLSRLNNKLHQLELQLKQCLYEYEGKTVTQLNDELATIKNNADSLRELLPALRKFGELPKAVQDFVRTVQVSPVQAEAAMADKTLQQLFLVNRTYAGITQKVIAETVQLISKYYKQLLQLNSDFIRATRRNKFLQGLELSNTSVTVLNPDQRQMKKVYSDGRRILEHEMGKVRSFKSIREIASNESGVVLKDIKPVWLMSPLSVSDSLPLNTSFFDVVIFDEASQITLEEGIPALFRGPQSIIVGDEKQMPPSNFFSAKADDPEDLEIVEGEKEDELLCADSDSLLVQGSRKLNSTMLSWHYRSRHETLISYSNFAFYASNLLTIPDKTIHHHEKPLKEIQQVEEGFANAGSLLDNSISFHYLPNSIYESRSNLGEAKYIAQMIKKLLTDNVQETIGVVAFSQEQQGIIEEAIDQLAATDKNFEELLERSYNRKDEGQFTGLFVKNLENVQGDERDIIIMSVCYGHDSNKKMLMNFGPINKKGGEKRLNVIFSRARKHMAIVSSIRHFHITNEYNDGANYFKRFLQYAEMVSTGNMNGARMILDSLMTDKQKTEIIVPKLSDTTRQVKSHLEKAGYFVDECIGQSSFKCTLGVKSKPGDTDYCLGILIDDDTHYQNANLVEQYFQRPSILTSFGWKVYSVFAKDWWENKEKVLASIINKIKGKDEQKESGSEVLETGTAPEQKKDELEYTRLNAPDMSKFWEIAQKGKEVFIRSGRSGTKGIVQVKTFSSEYEAESMKVKLLEEQLELGYVG